MAEHFVVSALKYRPQTFDTVVGQGHITNTLKNAIKSGQLAHSFLFCGPRGVGKTTCARILAKTINCMQPTEAAEACDTCDNCISFKNNTSFNVHELDAASNNSVDDIRQLTEQVRYAPQAGSKYKVYIIDEVHMLSASAFNAFLKTLEEPPAHAIFILATTEKHKILPTILSRCQIFDFKRITTKDTVTHLIDICSKEKVSAEEDALHFIALKSEGCMRDSLSIMDKIISFSGGKITYVNTIENLNILDYDYFFKMMEAVAVKNLTEAMLMFDDILSKGFEGDMFMNGLAEHCRNLMMCKDQRVVGLMDVAQGIKERYFTQANSISNNLLVNAMSILNQTEITFKQARNKRLHVEMAIIKLCHLQDALELIAGQGGEILKKKVSNNKVSSLISKVAPSLQIEVENKVVPTISLEKKIPIVKNEISLPTAEIINTPEEIIVPKVIAKSLIGSQLMEEEEDDDKPISLQTLRLVTQKAKQALAEKASLQKVELTQESLQTIWEKAIIEFTSGQEFNQKSMQNTRLQADGDKVKVTAVETMGFDFLVKMKQPLTQFFRQESSNNDVELLIEKDLSNAAPLAPIRSKMDVLQDFIKENPLIIKLITDLDLEQE